MDRPKEKVARVEVTLNAIMFRALDIRAQTIGDDNAGVIRGILADRLSKEIEQAMRELPPNSSASNTGRNRT